MYDGSTSQTGLIKHSVQFTDDNSYLTCIGGRQTSTTTAQDSCSWMFHDVYLYSNQINIADVNSLASNSWNNPCPVCPSAISPTCTETLNTAYIANWNFVKTSYQSTITDTSPNAFNIALLNNQSSYDPVYVDNQGLYFNSNKFLRTTGRWKPNNINSITVESWIRPTDTVLNGDLLSFDSGTNQKDVSFSFSGGNIVVKISGVSATIPITYTAAMQNTWMYVGVSLFKTSPTTSRVCVAFATMAEQWTTINTVLKFTNAAGDLMTIGNQYTGLINNLKIYDWPKTGYEWTSQYQTSGWTPWNGVSWTMCPSSTGKCISTWNHDQYGASCTQCLSPYCSSCYAGTNVKWFEWLSGYNFTYMGQSCPGVCGNGIIDLSNSEVWDDGNTNSNDGCSSTWTVESGWTWTNSTPTSPSVWKKACAASNYFGVDEWNDGNLSNGDGCDSTWKIERGWKCINGSPTKPDTCSELWGDGINYGQHECDDGNNINGDGWDENWTVEYPGPPKWLWSSGNKQAPDFCHEWCGDGYRFENPWLYNPLRNLFRLQEVTCDDGNLRSGEGCDGLWRIEDGFNWNGGNSTYPDVWNEDWGDRRTFYYNQCDDG